MENFAVYLGKSALWITGFALVFFLFLRNERFFILKRVYLIAGILASLIFPLISFHYNVEVPAPEVPPGMNTLQVLPGELAGSNISVKESSFRPDIKNIILTAYLTGIVFLAVRMIRQIKLLFKKIKFSKISNLGNARLVRTAEFPMSFSFFNYVFISPSMNEAEMEPVIKHELTHVRQKHWLDLILAEIFCLFQWINPFTWLYSGYIRQNHEYIADKAVLESSAEPGVYKAVLLNQMFDTQVISLSNSFNYSMNKSRFEMMKTKISSPWRKLKILLVLPFIAGVFYAFAIPEYRIAYQDSNTDESYDSLANSQNDIKGIVLNEDGEPVESVAVSIVTPIGNKYHMMTGPDGRFKINNVNDDATLLFFNIEYKRLTLKPDSKNDMTVKLERDPEYVRAGTESSESFVVVDEMPSFPGGAGALMDFINKNLKYPEAAKDNRIEGRVIVKFLINSDGIVEQVSVLKGVDDQLDAEAMKVVSSLPAFIPGKQAGKPVNVWYLLPVTFSLHEGSKADSSPQTFKSQDQNDVKGIIIDESGKPLKSVNIGSTGTPGDAKFVNSDSEGRFILVDIEKNAVLSFSLGGYKSQSVKPDFQNEMKIVMVKNPNFKEPRTESMADASKPLVVLDGIKTDQPAALILKNLGDELGIITNLRGKEATDKYGEEGKNGVTEIYTKKKAAELGIKIPFSRRNPEDFPTFQGNRIPSFTNWVLRHVTYPEEARIKGIQGRITANFTLEPDGSIGSVNLLGNADPLLGNALIKTIKLSPKWDPPKNPEAAKEPFSGTVSVKFSLPDIVEPDNAYVMVEDMPLYPGGAGALLKFINENVKYPEKAKADNISGRVIVRFIVNTKGNVEEPIVLKGVSPELDDEAVRVVSMLKGFKPGTQNGEPVNVYYMVPITFSLK